MNLQRIPVTIITGFLGSGKTTLLNRILSEHHGHRIAVIENEFGEVGVDDALVIRADEEIFEMNNGCICCTVRGDLIRILGNLVRRRNRFDYVLIETTGLADPGPVAQTFFVDEDIRDHFRLDGIVTLVDAGHVDRHLHDSRECQEQIAFADRLILNKTDLATAEQLDLLEQRLRSMNHLAEVRRTRHAEIPVHDVLNLHAFDLDRKLELNADFLKPELPFEWSGVLPFKAGLVSLHFQPGPDASIDLVLLPITSTDSAHLDQTRQEAVTLFSQPPTPHLPQETLRPGHQRHRLDLTETPASFRVAIEHSGPFLLLTQHHPSEFQLEFEQNAQMVSPLIEETHAPAHSHDNSVASVAIQHPGALDANLFQQWISQLLQERGTDIFRMKGILHLHGSPDRVVYQGVHMLLDAKPHRPWLPDEPRGSVLVFIGRNLDRTSLTQGFLQCLRPLSPATS